MKFRASHVMDRSGIHLSIFEKFKGFAYDDFPFDKADDHEQSLKKDNIDYVRIEL